MNSKIVLLVCDQFPGILTPDIPSYEWMFEEVFTKASEHKAGKPSSPFGEGWREAFEIYQTWQGSLPTRLNRDDLYLITGSNNSAYDNVPMVASLRDWIRYAYSTGCKLCGICFGHQIIAEALGGKVERSPKGWGIGIRRSYIIDSVFKGIAKTDSFSLVYDHHDQVVRLPKNAILVSQSDFCPLESFRVGMQILTFQGHPEFTNAFIRHWINDCAPDEPQSVKANALHSLETIQNQGITVAKWILDFFL